MTHEPAPSRRDAIRTLTTLGVASVVLPAVLAGCSTGASKRVKARGGTFGDPIPEDPVVIHNPWSPESPTMSRGPNGLLTPEPMVGAVPRSRWTRSAPVNALANPMGSIRRITVHHDAIDPLPTSGPDDVARRLESIRRGHVQRGWADIGYHYAIDPAGRVWQGRPLSLQGAHVGEQNQSNIGIVLLGNFDRQAPTPQSLDALDRLIAIEMRRFRISLGEIRTHREMAPTACPGRNLQREMDRTRSRGGRLASLAAGDHRG